MPQKFLDLVGPDFWASQDPDKVLENRCATFVLTTVSCEDIELTNLSSYSLSLASSWLHADVRNLWVAYQTFTLDPYTAVPDYLAIEGELAAAVQSLIIEIINTTFQLQNHTQETE